MLKCLKLKLKRTFKEELQRLSSKFYLKNVEPNIQYKAISGGDDIEADEKNIGFIKDITMKLKIDRALDFDNWLSLFFAIIGACKKSNIGKTSCCNLIHQFSQNSTKKVDENEFDKWIDENYKKQVERTNNQYGFKYLIHV